jgi:NAD(P)-dependent dehydrogenase (short-subunit alcohol dehydrogenase family)
MIDAVSLAERRLARAWAAVPAGGEPRTARASPAAVEPAAVDPARRARHAALAPLLRGALARAGRRVVVAWRDDPEILELLARARAEQALLLGPVTPDHVIRIRPFPLLLGSPGADPSAEIDAALAGWSRSYDAWFESGCAARGTRPQKLDACPRVALIPDLGAACLGATLAAARVAGDVVAHTARVILDALALGAYRPVGALDLFDVEYWSLEQAKLGKSRPAPLAGQVALVTGAAGGIGRATAEHLLELGAQVLIADRDEPRLGEAHASLAGRFGAAVASSLADVAQPGQAERCVADAVAAFGGLDLVVSNAGSAPSGLLHEADGDRALALSLQENLLSHQAVARAAVTLMLAQGAGGCLLFNASKSSFAPGPEFGPYAVPKAAVVALMRQYAIDYGRHGIRANAVNADRVRTGLFAGGVLEARARARGLEPDEYFRNNLLGRETTARDVADAFGWLATAQATTGAVVPVDGGNPAAFPR